MHINTNLPRALRGSVRADQSTDLYNQIQATLTDMRSQNGARLDGLEETVQNLIGNVNGMESRSFPNSSGTIVPVDAAYTNTFATYFRRGDGEEALREANATGERATIQAAMSVGDNSAGGFLAPVEYDRKFGKLRPRLPRCAASLRSRRPAWALTAHSGIMTSGVQAG